MALSERQRAANQANALKSTGPRSIEGKSRSSRNATRHGLFTDGALVDGEDPDEFAALVADLQDALAPVGALELGLVEKIALAMWRQRRLAFAEAAAIRLQRKPPHVAKEVAKELDVSFEERLTLDDLLPFDPTHAEWCRSILAEEEVLDAIDLETLPKKAPLIYANLQSDAEEDGETIEEHLDHDEYGLTGFVGRLTEWCRAQLAKAEQRPKILATAEQVRTRSLVLHRPYQELLARYQTTLNNELYKALKALRDVQEWRLKTIDTQPEAMPVSDD